MYRDKYMKVELPTVDDIVAGVRRVKLRFPWAKAVGLQAGPQQVLPVHHHLPQGLACTLYQMERKYLHGHCLEFWLAVSCAGSPANIFSGKLDI